MLEPSFDPAGPHSPGRCVTLAPQEEPGGTCTPALCRRHSQVRTWEFGFGLLSLEPVLVYIFAVLSNTTSVPQASVNIEQHLRDLGRCNDHPCNFQHIRRSSYFSSKQT